MVIWAETKETEDSKEAENIKEQPDARDTNLPKKCPLQVPSALFRDPLQSGYCTTNRILLKSHLKSSDMSLRSEQAF